MSGRRRERAADAAAEARRAAKKLENAAAKKRAAEERALQARERAERARAKEARLAEKARLARQRAEKAAEGERRRELRSRKMREKLLEETLESSAKLFNAAMKLLEGKDGLQRDRKRGLELLRAAALAGHAEAQLEMGHRYWNGEDEDIEKDDDQAVKFYMMAAEQDNAVAQWCLGWCHEQGWGDHQSDMEEAARLYGLAAEQGHAKAQCNLAMCYETGEGLEANMGEAVRLYRLSADRGYALAQYNLGACYQEGTFVPLDLVEASRLYLLAADQGNKDAAKYLGLMYYRGEGVNRNFETALRWLRYSGFEDEEVNEALDGIALEPQDLITSVQQSWMEEDEASLSLIDLDDELLAAYSDDGGETGKRSIDRETDIPELKLGARYIYESISEVPEGEVEDDDHRASLAIVDAIKRSRRLSLANVTAKPVAAEQKSKSHVDPRSIPLTPRDRGWK